MSSILQVTSLKDVKPFKSGWKVHVKVLHSWKQYNAVHGDTLEIVLSDENGNKIHASCKKTYMESKAFFMLAHGDVIGQVMELGELETIQVAGNPRRKVEFTLRDI
uniref:Replication protein A 70 kDa DNA-binding subunit B/D first OB fold domain-containing protein n=1 Tax=Brassica oleracea var. oleracea TaxID=109376 RepID=A0A0D3CR78_BRAOL